MTPNLKAIGTRQDRSAENLATKNDIADVKRELTVVKWLLGTVIAAQVLPLLRAIGVISG